MTASQEAETPVRSHSQLNQYTECPRSYELSRVRRIKRRPGPWFPAGSAVHATIERYLREQVAEEGDGA
jgi:putative RecB family exonuclease